MREENQNEKADLENSSNTKCEIGWRELEIEMSMEVRNRTQSGVVEMKEKINLMLNSGNDRKS